MEEFLNLFVELYHGIAYSRFINEKKPYAKYACNARKLSREEGRVLICSIREKDWMIYNNKSIPAYILFKGRNHFSPYVLDRELAFIQRLYNIRKPEEYKSDVLLLVELNA